MDIFEIIKNCDIDELYILLRQVLKATEIRSKRKNLNDLPEIKTLSEILSSTDDNGDTPVLAAFYRLETARQNEEDQSTIDLAWQCLFRVTQATHRLDPDALSRDGQYGETPLAVAIRIHEFDIFKALSKKQELLNGPCFNELKPLEYAISIDANDETIWLLNLDAPYNANALIDTPESSGDDAGRLARILYQTLRQTPLTARLIAAILNDDLTAVDTLASNPETVQALAEETWFFICQQALPQNDKAVSVLVPHLRAHISLDEIQALAIATDAQKTVAILDNI